jgi:DNA adenine methylase
MLGEMSTQHAPVAVPLKWHGGKSYLARRIIARMPRHLHYVEPFAGGLAVLLARNPADPDLWLPPHKGVSEVVNDLNERLVNFWRVLREEGLFRRFHRQVQAVPLSRRAWEEAHVHARGTDPVADAVAFFVDCRQSLAGRMTGFTPVTRTRLRRGMNGNISEWLGAIDGLPLVHARLRQVLVECRPAVELIRREDGPGTLFYCLLPENRVRTCDGRFIPVSEVLPGTVIEPGRTVQAVFRRRRVGGCVRVKAQGLPTPLVLTDDHLLPRIPAHNRWRQEKRTDEQLWSACGLVEAGALARNDYLLVPLGGTSSNPDWRVDPEARASNARRVPATLTLGPALCRLLGYYAAEGHIQRQGDIPYSVILSFGEHERATWVADAVRCTKEAFGVTPLLQPGPSSDSVLQVCIHSAAVAEFVAGLIPGIARNRSKRLAPSILALPPDLQQEVLRGWLRGDGGLDVQGRGRWKLLGSSVSRTLSEQMYVLGLRCGLRPSFKIRAGRIFDVYFASEDAERLGWAVPRKRTSCSTRRILNGHMLVRVREVERFHHDGEVIDISVDGDHLFAAPFALVHNCDPPYLHATRASTDTYVHEMGEADHRELLDVLLACKGKVMLSGYPSALYDQVLAGWTRYTFDLPNHAAGGKRKARETEVLWCNFCRTQ